MKRKLLLVSLLVLALPMFLFSAPKVWRIVLVGKVILPMFENTYIGMYHAAKDLGGVEVTMVNPAEADPAEQVSIVEDQIARGVDAIFVVPDDPGALEQVFAKANKAGILTFTHESILSKNISYDIEAFDNAEFGRHHMDNLAAQIGGEGGYICFVGNLTAVTHNQWVDAEIAYQKQKYPKMHLLRDRLVSSESTQVAYEKTLEAIKTYGDDLRGVIGSSAADPPGAGLAVAEKGLQDKIAVVGTSIGSMSGQGLEDGSIKIVSIWDPQKIGYAATVIIKSVLEGKKITNGMDVKGLGKIAVNGKVITGEIGGILDITKDNYKKFKF
ncbi:MAG: substrate-binding domain-containing protein [Spirochaetia bacterium]